MITRKILTLFSILFLSTVVFAQNKTVVFFAESIEGLPAKVVQKIEGTDNFCFAASFTEEKNIKKGIKKLIFCRKIEPMLDIAEPYFSLIGSEKQLGDELVFNRTTDCENIIKSYKTKYRKAFKIYKHGLYLRGAALDYCDTGGSMNNDYIGGLVVGHGNDEPREFDDEFVSLQKNINTLLIYQYLFLLKHFL